MSNQEKEAPEFVRKARKFFLAIDIATVPFFGVAPVLAGEIIWRNGVEGYKALREAPNKLGRQVEETFPSYRSASSREGSSLPQTA